MRHAVSHLSSQHVQAITAISHDLRMDDRGSQAGKIMANAAMLLPNLDCIQMRILRSRLPVHKIDSIAYTCKLNEQEYAVQKFVPHWFYSPIVEFMAECHAWAGQKGKRWEVEWPQMNDNKYFRISEAQDPGGELRLSPCMGSEAVGNVHGVQMCPCTCGNIEWVSANLVKETGRRIKLDTVYHGPEYRPLPPLDAKTAWRIEMGPNAVFLDEHAPPLDLVKYSFNAGEVSVHGYAYEADEDYWEAKRWKNRDWMALFRGVWKSLTNASHTSRNS